jgi:hypothetical protein
VTRPAENGNGRQPHLSEISSARKERAVCNELGHSGRRLVILGLLSLFIIWAILALSFLVWKANYRERIRWGEKAIPSALAPLTECAPPGINPGLWGDTLAETKVMLQRLVRSGILSRTQMQNLEMSLRKQAREVKPEGAGVLVLHIWDTAELDAGNVLAGIRYPAILIPAMVIRPLDFLVPPETNADAWHQAVEHTRELFVSPRRLQGRTAQELEKVGNALSAQMRNATRDKARDILEKLQGKEGAEQPIQQNRGQVK